MAKKTQKHKIISLSVNLTHAEEVYFRSLIEWEKTCNSELSKRMPLYKG
ncbi:MAG: hypothetical protein NTZ97_01695 [Candidatus Moranbacteria bacterium]|nr:hypothetical protein [Candidatus Moranbacteria bacterium]